MFGSSGFFFAPRLVVATTCDVCSSCVEMTWDCAGFWRAHKGWTVLSLSHRGREDQEKKSQKRLEGGDRPVRLRLRDTRGGHRSRYFNPDIFFFIYTDQQSGNRTRRTENPEQRLVYVGAETRKCERGARTRLRCRDRTLAALLGCRSHRWKMLTSSLSFSSGKFFTHKCTGDDTTGFVVF